MVDKTATAKKSAEKESKLPPIKNGELATIRTITVVGKETQPPKRYTEALLLDDMQNAGKFMDDPELKKTLKRTSGLGTGATRAGIIEKLKSHKYIEETKENWLVSTAAGRELIKYVPPSLYDIARTAYWEAVFDLIELKGGRVAFEENLVKEITKLIGDLKAKGPLSSSPNPHVKGDSRMATNAPTPKMLDFAKKVAERKGIKLPKEVTTSFDECKKFLDENATPSNGGAYPPSEKQLSYAKSIAEKKGLDIPEDALAEGKKLSAWIDENK